MRIAISVGLCLGFLGSAACSDGQSLERTRENPTVTPPSGSAGQGSLPGLVPVKGGAGMPAGVAGRAGVAGAAMVPVPPAGAAGTNVPPAVPPGLPPAGGAAAPVAGQGPIAGAMPPAGGAPAPMTPPVTGDRSLEGTCARWKADRAVKSEGTWSGSVDTCEPGDISPDGRENALRILNLYRWLADLPPVTTDPTMDKQAQACALMMRANNTLSHTPPMTWKCYSMEGATGAGRCNISSGPGVASVDGYMVDPGNPTTIGHRRWILSNSFGPTGLGSTDRHSCMMTFGKMKAGKPWMAWPSPGVIPLQAMQGGFGQKVDATGWTVQSDSINLSSAQVTVTSDGMPMPVTVTQLMGGYGSRYAFRFNPMGWSTTAGKTYDVAVTGTPMPINYSVQIVDCK